MPSLTNPVWRSRTFRVGHSRAPNPSRRPFHIPGSSLAEPPWSGSIRARFHEEHAGAREWRPGFQPPRSRPWYRVQGGSSRCDASHYYSPLNLSRAPPDLLRRDSHQKNILRGPRVLNECASAWPTLPEADSTTDQATDASTGSRVAFSSVSLRSLAVSVSGDFWALVSGEHTERPSK
jgi:hypothetical protein